MRTSHLAQVPREAGQTQTLEAVHLVLTAAAVQTRWAGTFVHVPLAVLASKAGGARAAVPVHQVLRKAQTQINVRCMWPMAPAEWSPNNNCEKKGSKLKRERRGWAVMLRLFQHIFLVQAQLRGAHCNLIWQAREKRVPPLKTFQVTFLMIIFNRNNSASGLRKSDSAAADSKSLHTTVKMPGLKILFQASIRKQTEDS